MGEGRRRTRQAPAADDAPPAPTHTPAPSSKRQRKGSAPRQTNTGTSTTAATTAAKPQAHKPTYYLVKSEPHEFSIDDLEARPSHTEGWEGVRNAQARNIMRGMARGDQALFYHSSCKTPAVVGIVKVVREAYPDATATQAGGRYFDPKASAEDPRWWQVDFQLVRRLSRPVTLAELRRHAGGALAGMALLTRPRLSVQPVTEAQWRFVLGLEAEQQAQGGEPAQ